MDQEIIQADHKAVTFRVDGTEYKVILVSDGGLHMLVLVRAADEHELVRTNIGQTTGFQVILMNETGAEFYGLAAEISERCNNLHVSKAS